MLAVVWLYNNSDEVKLEMKNHYISIEREGGGRASFIEIDEVLAKASLSIPFFFLQLAINSKVHSPFCIQDDKITPSNFGSIQTHIKISVCMVYSHLHISILDDVYIQNLDHAFNT